MSSSVRMLEITYVVIVSFSVRAFAIMVGVATQSKPSHVEAGAKVGSGGTTEPESSSCGSSARAGINSLSLDGIKSLSVGDANLCFDGVKSFLCCVEDEKRDDDVRKRQAWH
jgi:hypothetical protein